MKISISLVLHPHRQHKPLLLSSLNIVIQRVSHPSCHTQISPCARILREKKQSPELAIPIFPYVPEYRKYNRVLNRPPPKMLVEKDQGVENTQGLYSFGTNAQVPSFTARLRIKRRIEDSRVFRTSQTTCNSTLHCDLKKKNYQTVPGRWLVLLPQTFSTLAFFGWPAQDSVVFLGFCHIEKGGGQLRTLLFFQDSGKKDHSPCIRIDRGWI